MIFELKAIKEYEKQNIIEISNKKKIVSKQ